MGLFDTVHCEYPLPDERHQDLEFQTKNLECFLGTYTITRDGRLVRHALRGGRGPERDIEWPIHGDIRIYESLDKVWVEYIVRFTHGQVEWIRPLEKAPQAPILPPESDDWEPFPNLIESLRLRAKSPPSSPPAATDAEVEAARDTGHAEDAAPNPEEALLAGLRRDRRELETLLQKSSDHWGYEDPVYRFYHQSFKVYGLQQQTEAIVQRLQALAPDVALNPWFLQIIQSGTGKVFQMEDNARWMEMTRPILEAFFHARFFLEMAVRYADLTAPPQPLPSGYAALLYLFGMR